MSDSDPQSSLTTITSTWLLEGLQDPGNDSAWSCFVGRYRPVIINYCKRFGFRGADAEDIAQLVLSAFAQAFRSGKYERDKGRLRQWLFGIARNHLLNAVRRRGREIQVDAANDETDFFAQVPAEPDMSRMWDAEWRDAVLSECLNQVRLEVDPQTMSAFELFARSGWSAREVADKLDMTENAVFCAKRRILGRIRELLPQTDERW